ncbi:hypothetical protein [Burkholderia pseudomallei]|uniref:hypothetical protein n=1 Tax=Burkholderia pseudomallei TaxID=28450 RepID=UPI00057229EF|nr:hypothetical protein [Burkholderia pseudomallei]
MSVRVPQGGRDASRDTKRFGRHERHERKASSCGDAIDLPPVRAGAAVRLRKRRPASRTGGRASDSIEPTGARSGNPAERTGDEPGEANRANAPLRGPAARPTSSPIGEGLADNAKRHEAARSGMKRARRAARCRKSDEDGPRAAPAGGKRNTARAPARRLRGQCVIDRNR